MASLFCGVTAPLTMQCGCLCVMLTHSGSRAEGDGSHPCYVPLFTSNSLPDLELFLGGSSRILPTFFFTIWQQRWNWKFDTLVDLLQTQSIYFVSSGISYKCVTWQLSCLWSSDVMQAPSRSLLKTFFLGGGAFLDDSGGGSEWDAMLRFFFRSQKQTFFPFSSPTKPLRSLNFSFCISDALKVYFQKSQCLYFY